jgi:hypothetical protein
VTNESVGQRASGGAAVEHPIDHTLAYVLKWQNVPCVPAGAPPGSTPTPTTCSLYSFVDANTGKTIYGFQSSTGPYQAGAPNG